MRNKKILLVDDEESIRKSFGMDLRRENYDVTLSPCGEEAITLLQDNKFDLVITDLMMGGTDGLQLLKEVKKIAPQTPVIILTGYGDLNSAVDAIRLDADDYLQKPCDFDELLYRITRCLAKKDLLDQLQEQNERLNNEITQRRHIEKSLEESEATLEKIMLAVPVGLGLIHNQVFIWLSEQLTNMVSYAKQDLIGESEKILYADNKEYQRVLSEKNRRRDEFGIGEIETRWRCNDGREIDVHLRSTFIDSQAPSAGTIFAAVDITKKKEAEAALYASSEKIKLFAYSVSHDLKNPAIAIHGLTKLLVKKYQDVLAGKGKIYCEQLIKSSEQIATLVEQINVYISTEEHPVTIEKFNPKKILQIVRGEHESQLTDRGVKLLVPEHLSEIRADRLCILRVFGNFIDNALKYGGDKLSEIKIAYEETEKFHIFSVTNDGVGLEQKDCSRIFGLFKRENRAKNVEGTGLGLAIVKKIAELHNGKVWGESPNKKGVAFYFSISKFL